MNDWVIGAAHVAVAVAMCFGGWVLAHKTVAVECNRLGSFYVGSTVYECKEKK
jgi:hypothetical protein